jgi:hypothetical protein
MFPHVMSYSSSIGIKLHEHNNDEKIPRFLSEVLIFCPGGNGGGVRAWAHVRGAAFLSALPNRFALEGALTGDISLW